MTTAPLIPPDWSLPDRLRSRLGTTVGRQRVMEHDGHLLIIAHQVPEPSEKRRRGVLFWRDATGDWKASNGESGKTAIENLIGSYESAILGFETREAAAERSDQYLELLDAIAPVQRAARNFSDRLQEARKARPDLHELVDARDRAYEMSRAAELLYQDAKIALDVAVVRRAEEQAASSEQMAVAAHRLNRLAATFFPIATLGAIFGTTLTEDWSWKESVWPFILFLVGGVLLGLMLASFVNRKSKKR